MAIALVILAYGTLNMVHALSPPHSIRRRVLNVTSWIFYVFELLFFFSGRKSREDRDTHILYASMVLALGMFIFVAALVA